MDGDSGAIEQRTGSLSDSRATWIWQQPVHS